MFTISDKPYNYLILLHILKLTTLSKEAIIGTNMREILAITPNTKPFEDFQEKFQSDFLLTIISQQIEGLENFKKKRFDLTFIDLNLIPEKDLSPQFLNDLKEIHPEAPIVLLSNQKNTPFVLKASEGSLCTYLNEPISSNEIKLITDQIFSQQIQKEELKHLRDQFWSTESLPLVNSQNPHMAKVLENIKSVAPTKSTVLLEGETGVGKSIFAQLIHQHSNRKNKQFIHVHCGAITESLLESELFGHEKGSFTGAFKRKLGKFELAHGGTIFLDEISTLTLPAQIKLLQVLQNSLFQRVGGETDVKIDIRVIAATNENLEELASQGKFRKDLLYRLNVFPIQIPPLRKRPEDISNMLNIFLEALNKTHQKNITSVQDEVLYSLSQYNWPGNVRELENLVERAYIIEKSNSLTTTGFPLEVIKNDTSSAIVPLNTKLSLAEARNQVLESFEVQYLKELLSSTNGTINTAADIAGIGVRQLNKLMQKYKLDKKDFKNQPMTHKESSHELP